MHKAKKLTGAAILLIFASIPCACAKNIKSNNKISYINRIVTKVSHTAEKSKKTDKKIPESLPSVSENEITNQNTFIIPKSENIRNISKTVIAWLLIVCMLIFILKILIFNFKIPIDYDPGSKNKKYKF